MKTALVVMTIMGCDDSVTQCNYLQTIGQTWTSVELCDAQTEVHMDRLQDENYPVIVAVCESADNRVTMEMAGQYPASPSVSDNGNQVLEAAVEEERAGLAAHALDVVRKILPDRSTLKSVVTTPVRFVEDGYSWAVKRFAD